MIDLKKNDALADAVKEILQQEALKGNQHEIDKNKNNKVDAHDFKILRGEKKAVKKEEVETVEEGLKDIAKKAFKALTGGSDEDQQKEEVEVSTQKTLKQFRENAFDWKKKPEPQPNGGSGVKQGSRYGGSKQKDKPEQETDEKK